jgi:hypothetical protein
MELIQLRSVERNIPEGYRQLSGSLLANKDGLLWILEHNYLNANNVTVHVKEHKYQHVVGTLKYHGYQQDLKGLMDAAYPEGHDFNFGEGVVDYEYNKGKHTGYMVNDVYYKTQGEIAKALGTTQGAVAKAVKTGGRLKGKVIKRA